MRLIFVNLLLFATTCLGQTPPTAQFTATPQNVCFGSPVNFINQSTNGSGTGTIVAWNWDFGDGTSSNQQNPSHTFAALGSYVITLTVQTSTGQADSEVKTNYITVNPLPVASFTATPDGCQLPVGVTFTNNSTGGSSYAWTFGNGQTSTSQAPSVVNYTTAGSNTASLIVTNSFGCKHTATKTFVISNFQAGITAPSTVCQNLPIAINDNSTVGTNTWNWSFSGASPLTSSTQNNSVTFPGPGTYTISLTAKNTTLGCEASTTKQITVLTGPSPSFTSTPSSGCAPTAVTYTNTSANGGSFAWNFGDGQTFNGQNPPPHTYTSNGSFSTSLTITFTNGCASTVTNPTVTLTPPNTDFTSNVINGCDPLVVSFTNTSSTTNPIATSVWNFGDGQTYTGNVPPPHVYSVGVYNVTLSITTSNGCTGTITKNNFIKVGKVNTVNFSVNTSPACVKTEVNFLNTSVISAPYTAGEVTYDWNFGDGNSSAVENPKNTYMLDTGYYDVSLIVAFRGCKDTLLKQDAVRIKAPISKFLPPQSLFCNPASFPVTVAVNDLSKIGKISDDCNMVWKWGDNQSTAFDDIDIDDANLGSTSHNYSTYGSYKITQIIYNTTNGCVDSTDYMIHISKIDAAMLALANDSVCVGSPLALNDNSTSTHPLSTFIWSMGNQQTVSGAQTSYAYPVYGVYTIKLISKNLVGCLDSAFFSPLVALANPSALISANDNIGCSPFSVTFTNSSSVENNGVPLKSYLFSFQDGTPSQTTTSLATVVNHTFATEGNYPVSLVATDKFGCSSPPAVVTISVVKPTANFSLPTVVCNLDTVLIADASAGIAPLSYKWFIDGAQQSTASSFSKSFVEPYSATQASFNHVVKLIVTDNEGCKDTLEKTIIISKPKALIAHNFSGASTNSQGQFLCPPLFASYLDSSLSYGNIASYYWTFGDGKSSVLANPVNTYSYPGVYTIKYSIVDEFGCKADTTLANFLTIFGPSAAPFHTQDLTVCGQNVVFDIGQYSNVTGTIWSLGDGSKTEDSLHFTHTYLNVSTYYPSVVVSDSNNCQVTYFMDSIVIPNNGINASFVPSLLTVELGQYVTFTDQSTGVNQLVSWTWDASNNAPITNTTPASVTTSYNLPGDYPVILLIKDSKGCFDSYSVTIHVDGDFMVPNVITPNGDGINDYLSLDYDILDHFDIHVVNRWGNLIYSASNQKGAKFWDGKTTSGTVCNDGVYFYILNVVLKGGQPLKKEGFIELLGTK